MIDKLHWSKPERCPITGRDVRTLTMVRRIWADSNNARGLHPIFRDLKRWLDVNAAWKRESVSRTEWFGDFGLVSLSGQRWRWDATATIKTSVLCEDGQPGDDWTQR